MMKRRNLSLKTSALLGLAMLTLIACPTAEKPSGESTPRPSMTPAMTPETSPAPAPAEAQPVGNETSQSMPAAPALQVAEWIKGEPVTLANGQGRQVYVVEFWATWCPPCLTSIPHLTEMQKKFAGKGVTFIGISPESDSKLVRDFVNKMGDKMDYTVALDNNRATDNAYNRPYGVNSIPHAYVIDKNGAIAWHGHPMNPKMEDLLETLTS